MFESIGVMTKKELCACNEEMEMYTKKIQIEARVLGRRFGHEPHYPRSWAGISWI